MKSSEFEFVNLWISERFDDFNTTNFPRAQCSLKQNDHQLNLAIPIGKLLDSFNRKAFLSSEF